MVSQARDGVGVRKRTLWRLLETYHASVYYARERPERYSQLGLKGGWMGYFASRSAALGVVPPPVVSACFYGFSDAMVKRALPDAWQYTTPSETIAVRYEVFDAMAARLLGARRLEPRVGDAADVLQTVVHNLAPHGRPMFAAHASAPRPNDPHLALFWAATALREYRGDAHVAALQALDVGPAASNVLMTSMGLTPSDQRTYRGWSELEWSDASRSLHERGWLAADGSVTREGHSRRAEIERITDQLVEPAWSEVDQVTLERLIDVLGPLVGAIVTAGEVPYPNGMGVPPAAELAVPR